MDSNPFRRQLQADDAIMVSLPREPSKGMERLVGDVPASTPESLPKSPERVRAKPSPPAVTPRKRGSRIEPLTSTTNQNSEQGPVLNPFSAESEYHPDVYDAATPSRNSTTSNPFLRRTKSTSKTDRPLDMSELASDIASTSIDESIGTNDNRNRQSLDVNAFQQLMLTGHASQVPIVASDSSGSLSASVSSRRSVSDTILDGTRLDEQFYPLAAKVIVESVPEMKAAGSLSRSSSMRIKPPPPKPRSRSGGKSSLSTSSPFQKTPPSPISNRPLSFQESDRSYLPPLPLPPPPPPPLSRRSSVRPRPSTPVAESQDMPDCPKAVKLLTPPPPPPPMRRSQSTSSRSLLTVKIKNEVSPLPPPPPPPPRKPRSFTNGFESGEKSEIQALGPGEEKEERAGSILVDLEKLQREVDELRGKYGTVTAHAIGD